MKNGSVHAEKFPILSTSSLNGDKNVRIFSNIERTPAP